jgi:hypothetical protein
VNHQLNAHDITAFRAEFFVDLPDVSDQQLLDALATDLTLVLEARTWGWADTAIRDKAATLLEESGIRIPE